MEFRCRLLTGHTVSQIALVNIVDEVAAQTSVAEIATRDNNDTGDTGLARSLTVSNQRLRRRVAALLRCRIMLVICDTAFDVGGLYVRFAACPDE